jgi:hypothetical protein
MASLLFDRGSETVIGAAIGLLIILAGVLLRPLASEMAPGSENGSRC